MQILHPCRFSANAKFMNPSETILEIRTKILFKSSTCIWYRIFSFELFHIVFPYCFTYEGQFIRVSVFGMPSLLSVKWYPPLLHLIPWISEFPRLSWMALYIKIQGIFSKGDFTFKKKFYLEICHFDVKWYQFGFFWPFIWNKSIRARRWEL